LTVLALAYAERVHAGQRRELDRAPFIEHVRDVARLLYRVGASDHVIAAGALHDTLEKTATQPVDLELPFGSRVTALVVCLTEDSSIRDFRARKSALRTQVLASGRDALNIFAADKISGASALARIRPELTGAHQRLADLKLEHYRQSLKLLEEHLIGSPLVDQLRAVLAPCSRGPLIPAHAA
jgi:(p)ppGpp synthase/HD superfamily hydrolase